MVQFAQQRTLHFLVPLDGSQLAESVLPAVQYLASGCHAKVMLLHIMEQHAPSTIHGERHFTAVAQAKTYLEEMAAHLRRTGLTVEYSLDEVKEHNVAQRLFELAQELAIDLVIMCTHGGLRDFLFGSIAQQALQRGTQSILLVPPKEDGSTQEFALHRILVLLDGTSAHEPAFPVALSLAQRFGASVHLVLVIPTLSTLSGEQAASGLLLPTTMRAVLDLAEQGATDYLEQVLDQCRLEGIRATTEVLRGDTVPTILALAERQSSDLIVMASHGKVGLGALLSGSIAPRIAGRTGRALLLVRVGQKGETSA